MTENYENLTFIETKGIYDIHSEILGSLGQLIYDEDIKRYVFLPKNKTFLKPYYIAKILSKLNELNHYQLQKYFVTKR